MSACRAVTPRYGSVAGKNWASTRMNGLSGESGWPSQAPCPNSSERRSSSTSGVIRWYQSIEASMSPTRSATCVQRGSGGRIEWVGSGTAPTLRASRRAADTRTGLCQDGPMADPAAFPVALYLQDAHDIRTGIELARRAEAAGFDAVWQADSRLVRDAVVPMAAFAAGDRAHPHRFGRHRHLDPQRGPPRQHVLDARRPRAGAHPLWPRRLVGPAGHEGGHRPGQAAARDARGRRRRCAACSPTRPSASTASTSTSTASSSTTCTRSAGRRTCRSTSVPPGCR